MKTKNSNLAEELENCIDAILELYATDLTSREEILCELGQICTKKIDEENLRQTSKAFEEYMSMKDKDINLEYITYEDVIKHFKYLPFSNSDLDSL